MSPSASRICVFFFFQARHSSIRNAADGVLFISPDQRRPPCLASRGRVLHSGTCLLIPSALGIAPFHMRDLRKNGIFYSVLTLPLPRPPVPCHPYRLRLDLYPSLILLQFGRLKSNPSPIRAYVVPPSRDTARSLVGSMVPSSPNTDLRT